MRRRILVVLALAAGCAVWATTVASGAGPSPGLSPPQAGLITTKFRYVAQPAGRTTEVQVLERETSRILRHMRIQGIWGIPLVAYDGTAEGLFGNGRTLLLAQSLYNGNNLRTTTKFALVDTQRMKVVRRIQLKGAFTFDALSRDGRYIYMIEYMSPEDPTTYRVRAYDLRGGGLLKKIVSDKRSWATDMRGIPMSRVWQESWAYTLYGGNARPFIHALDTKGVAAVCINLPWPTSPDKIFDYRLKVDGDGHLVVRGPNGRALAVIDRDTFKVISFVKNP
jgi:hypothetical protein